MLGSALLEGDAPARLVVVVTEELVEPLHPVLAVKPVRSGEALRAGQSPEMTGKPVGMPIAQLVPLAGRGKEDVGATVVGVVDALHAGVGDEGSRHLVVGGTPEQAVDAAALPGPTGGEEVAVRAELGVGVVLHQQALPIARSGSHRRNIGFGRPERSDDIRPHQRTIRRGRCL